jgi:hypothetical protein
VEGRVAGDDGGKISVAKVLCTENVKSARPAAGGTLQEIAYIEAPRRHNTRQVTSGDNIPYTAHVHAHSYYAKLVRGYRARAVIFYRVPNKNVTATRSW